MHIKYINTFKFLIFKIQIYIQMSYLLLVLLLWRTLKDTHTHTHTHTDILPLFRAVSEINKYKYKIN